MMMDGSVDGALEGGKGEGDGEGEGEGEGGMVPNQDETMTAGMHPRVPLQGDLTT